MSSILDALRKSEHERQVASGQSASMLYPIGIKKEGQSWRILTLLGVTLTVILAIVLWMAFRPMQTEPSNTSSQPSNSANPQAKVISTVPLPENSTLVPNEKNKKEKARHDFAQKKMDVPTRQEVAHKIPSHAESISNAPAASNQAASGDDPLKGLPELNIAGYIHNSQSGNLAMINNHLVHEGEEISHGLVLVKILDDKAVFSYNGYVFSR